MFKPPAHKSGTAASIKLSDGCCHKTVVERCKDCSFGPNVYADAGPLTRQIEDFQSSDNYYTSRQGMNTTQRGKLAAAIGRQEAPKADDATLVSPDWESRYNRLKQGLAGIVWEYGNSSMTDGAFLEAIFQLNEQKA